MKTLRLLALLLCLMLLIPSASADKLHFALRGREAGPCQRLLSDVEILVIFVNTPQHPWTQAQREAVYSVSYSSVDYMEEAARQYHADFRPELGFWEVTVSTEFSKDLAWYWEILHNEFHVENIAQLEEYYKRELNKDEVPILFMFNSWDLSHTYMAYVDYPDWNEEFCVIFCDTDMHDQYLNHELFHQYGAIDLYDYNGEGVERIAENIFGKSLMLCNGKETDELTAYLIGWTDTLTPACLRFLEQTEGLRD